MIYTLSWSTGFRRGFKKATRNNTDLQEKIFTVLEKLSTRPFDPELKTHKLHGKLSGLWACQVEYDCRIVFAFESEPDSVILELKTVDELTAVHQAQLLNYLKATGKPLGLLINFKGKKAVIRRLALDKE